MIAHPKCKFFASDSFYPASNVEISDMEIDNEFEHKDEKECIEDDFGIFGGKGSKPA